MLKRNALHKEQEDDTVIQKGVRGVYRAEERGEVS
jgi:hypothetical protein